MADEIYRNIQDTLKNLPQEHEDRQFIVGLEAITAAYLHRPPEITNEPATPEVLSQPVIYDEYGNAKLNRPDRLYPYDNRKYEIDKIGLNRRLRNILVNAGIASLSDLKIFLDNDSLGSIRNMGPKNVTEIIKHIQPYLTTKVEE